MDYIEEEHPIPQQISSYQFRLVGDMTIKQFFQVAAGALISLLLYSSSLAVYIKWPLILLSFLAGIAFAFFPLQDRPLSKWVSLFIKAIYSPTVYVWKKTDKRKQYFGAEEPLPPLKPQAPTSQAAQPKGKAGIVESTATQVDLNPYEEPIQKKLNISEENFLNKINKQFSTDQGIKAKVIVPKKGQIEVDHQQKPVESSQEFVSTNTGQIKITPQAGTVIKDVKKAEFSPEAAPPIPPLKANIIVGQVLNQNGNIVENAILEIRDSEGRPVRALKSNKLGHFMIVTPLTDGTYQIITEKEGFSFVPLSVNLKSKILEPIIIKGNESLNT